MSSNWTFQITEEGTQKAIVSFHFVRILLLVCYVLDKTRLMLDACTNCKSGNLSSFPILSDESFTFNCAAKSGVEMEIKRR
jgi:hypothetical protein